MRQSAGKVTRWAILAMAIVALLIPVFLVGQRILLHTDGHLTLPGDAAFMNVIAGKNLGFYGVWGLSRHLFQTVAPSLSYPLLLAIVFFVGGPHLLVPLLLNGLAAICFLLVLQRWLIRQGVSITGQLGILLLVIFLIPLPLLVISGTEYMLQLLCCLLFLTSLKEKITWRVYLYALLLVATRYEGLVIVPAACLFFYRKQWRVVIRLLLVSVLPIVVFGLISLSKGSTFIPEVMFRGLGSPSSVASLAGCVLIFLGMVASRYGVFTVRRQRMAYSLALVLAIPLLLRSVSLLKEVQQDCNTNYDQQYQAADFIHRYYYHYAIAADAINTLCWMSEGRKLDVTGLANRDIRKRKLQGTWAPSYTDTLCLYDNVRLAFLTDGRNETEFLRRTKLAVWQQRHTGDSITVYAIDTAEIKPLKEHLREYERFLPGEVTVRYY